MSGDFCDLTLGRGYLDKAKPDLPVRDAPISSALRRELPEPWIYHGPPEARAAK
jgi:hypothetical protein